MSEGRADESKERREVKGGQQRTERAEREKQRNEWMPTKVQKMKGSEEKKKEWRTGEKGRQRRGGEKEGMGGKRREEE